MKTINIGIIGGGLMGKELASAASRWFVLNDFPVKIALIAVCDLNPDTLNWYRKVPGVLTFTNDYKVLLGMPELDVVYVAVPHHLHEQIYIDVINAGKDLLAEKPFGIDLRAATNIYNAAVNSNSFVRCSSEFPFLPGAQRIVSDLKSMDLGALIQVKSGFHHSSDLDPLKPINWKRQNQFCGEIGVMGDLGMHAVHLPLRLGWFPVTVHAQLQKIYSERPDGKGGFAPCDTWDNATLNTEFSDNGKLVPLTIETKRMAPGEMNSWFIEILGTNGGLKYSTKDAKSFWTFKRGKDQAWERTELGFHGQFPTSTGGIFETGFPDCFQQMIASFIAEREGFLSDRFTCATPLEALQSHKIFNAALISYKNKSVVNVNDSNS